MIPPRRLPLTLGRFFVVDFTPSLAHQGLHTSLDCATIDALCTPSCILGGSVNNGFTHNQARIPAARVTGFALAILLLVCGAFLLTSCGHEPEKATPPAQTEAQNTNAASTGANEKPLRRKRATSIKPPTRKPTRTIPRKPPNIKARTPSPFATEAAQTDWQAPLRQNSLQQVSPKTITPTRLIRMRLQEASPPRPSYT